MRNLNFQLKQLCQRNRDGSFATKSDRERLLYLIANQLTEMGFRQMEARSLRPKHVEALVARWADEKIAIGTIKNRMSALRWWAEKVSKQNVIERSNRAYDIKNRVYVASESKAKSIHLAGVADITDVYTAMSLRLQAAFGLRREESIKIMPTKADLGDKLRLDAPWTKGGKAREIPITSAAQREVLDAAKDLAKNGSLIPKQMSYVAQLQRYKAQCQTTGIGGMHGLRHQYAQSRYAALTGWPSPVAGGPTSRQLTAAQKVIDRAVRLQISAEMGHGREQITVTYLGR